MRNVISIHSDGDKNMFTTHDNTSNNCGDNFCTFMRHII